jgi:hypothetical protein
MPADTLLALLLNLRRRIENLEAHGPTTGIASIGTSFVVAMGTDNDDFTITAGANTYADDTELDVTITPVVTSTVIVWTRVQWKSDTVRALAAKFQTILDSTTVGGATENLGCHVAGSVHLASVMSVFTGVTAAAHLLELQAARVNAGDDVVVTQRTIVAIAIPE